MAHVTVTESPNSSSPNKSMSGTSSADELDEADRARRAATLSGASPYELLLWPESRCSHFDDAANVRHGRKGWELGKITVGLRYTTADGEQDHIDRRLSFSKPAEPRTTDGAPVGNRRQDARHPHIDDGRQN